MRSTKTSAFTLIELVVVIIIIAILAAVAVPKFYDRADSAREAATLQSLATLRSSIELYRADNGAYPGTLETDILSYLKGPFPETKVGGATSNAVKVVTSDPMTNADVDGAGGWIFNGTSGEIRINMASHFNF
ncbi:MAG: prepilin-type N-terminal cleavage/methylation domain-containing protein [Planctomycetota bacterium]